MILNNREQNVKCLSLFIAVGIILNYVLITSCFGSDLEDSVCHRAERLIFEDFSPQGVPIISLNFILVNH